MKAPKDLKFTRVLRDNEDKAREPNIRDVFAAGEDLPEGFTAWAGGPCPLDPKQRVQCLITTGEGIGVSAVSRAQDIGSWTHDQPGGLGHVVAYRQVDA